MKTAITLLAAMSWALISQGQSDLRTVAGRPEVWPREVTTRVASPAGPAGAVMKVVGLEGPLINLDYRGALYVLPVTQTDFVERAAANAANRPAPIRATPPPAAAPEPVNPAVATVAPAGSRNAVGVKLAPDLLVFDPASKLEHLIPGAGDVANRGYLLLQLGGGRRWGSAMKELVPAIQTARERGADFEAILVPLTGGTVQSTIALFHESDFHGPMVDPRKTQTVNDLWAKYGHTGTFALALVDPDGEVVARTVPVANARTVDKFHGVLQALTQVPPR